jgi:hypothetical protein
MTLRRPCPELPAICQHPRNLRLLQAGQADMEVIAEELAEPALGDDDHDRG